MNTLTPIFQSKHLHEVLSLKSLLFTQQKVATYICNNQGVYKELGFTTTDTFMYCLYAKEGALLHLPENFIEQIKEPTVLKMLTSDVKSVVLEIHKHITKLFKKTKVLKIEAQRLLKAS